MNITRRTGITRRRRITVEVERLVLGGTATPVSWCSECGTGAPMVSAEQAATLRGVPVRAIRRWANSRRIHFTFDGAGALVVCVRSLLSDE
ncbi:MAG: hypothetical protein HYS05_11780 [Acidobacteria bacterium]|nr:hypothetical protein [Acidobacteriota bacterium]